MTFIQVFESSFKDSQIKSWEIVKIIFLYNITFCENRENLKFIPDGIRTF